MDRDEANAILQESIKPWKQLSYEELVGRINHKTLEVLEVKAPSGKNYSLEIEARWDSRPGESIRVLGAIDDGGFFAALLPLSTDFIVHPPDKMSNK